MFKAITQPHDSDNLKWDKSFSKKRTAAFEKAQRYIDNEVLRRDDPLVPHRTGALRRSGIINTRLGEGAVKYVTPYARRLYYNPQYHFNGAPQRGGLWFERMKVGNKAAILNGAARILGAEGSKA